MDLLPIALFLAAFVTALPAEVEADDSKIETITDGYAKAGTLVILGDRRAVNLRCSGEGAQARCHLRNTCRAAPGAGA